MNTLLTLICSWTLFIGGAVADDGETKITVGPLEGTFIRIADDGSSEFVGDLQIPEVWGSVLSMSPDKKYTTIANETRDFRLVETNGLKEVLKLRESRADHFGVKWDGDYALISGVFPGSEITGNERIVKGTFVFDLKNRKALGVYPSDKSYARLKDIDGQKYLLLGNGSDVFQIGKTTPVFRPGDSLFWLGHSEDGRTVSYITHKLELVTHDVVKGDKILIPLVKLPEGFWSDHFFHLEGGFGHPFLHYLRKDESGLFFENRKLSSGEIGVHIKVGDKGMIPEDLKDMEREIVGDTLYMAWLSGTTLHLRTVNVHSGEMISQFDIPNEFTPARRDRWMGLSGSGKTAIVMVDGVIKFYNMLKGTMSQIEALGHPDVFPGDKYVVVEPEGRHTVSFYEVETGKPLSQLKGIGNNHHVKNVGVGAWYLFLTGEAPSLYNVETKETLQLAEIVDSAKYGKVKDASYEKEIERDHRSLPGDRIPNEVLRVRTEKGVIQLRLSRDK